MFRWEKNAVGIILLILIVVLSWPAFSQELELWEDDPFNFVRSEKEDAFAADAPEVNEPFFALVLQWAADDSLGTWSGDDVLAYAQRLGRPSKFPLDELISFSRSRPSPQDSEKWPKMNVKAVWKIELNGDQDPAMPYSILGYHPGTLRVSGIIRMSEVHLGMVELRSTAGPAQVSDIVLFRLEEGTLILDVDGWLDAILGKRLDDAATLGLVAARESGRLIGLAVSLGDEGRSIYGEIDFQQDKILPNGRAVASALSSACRSLFIQGMDDPLARAWGR